MDRAIAFPLSVISAGLEASTIPSSAETREKLVQRTARLSPVPDMADLSSTRRVRVF
jgi:hypothetical protein